MKELKNIAIMAAGSRGDIQPYIAIGVALQKAGYNVFIFTNTNHGSFVKSFDLAFVSTGVDFEKLMKEDENLLQIMAEGKTEDLMKSLEGVVGSQSEKECRAFLQYTEKNLPDLFIVTPFSTFFGAYAARVLKVPTLDVKLQLMVFNPEKPTMGMPALGDAKLQEQMFLSFVGKWYDGWKRKEESLKSLGKPGIMSIYHKSRYIDNFLNPPFPVIICQSPLFKDILYPTAKEKHVFVGASVLNSTQQKEHNDSFGGVETEKRIEIFLNEDKDRKPVYCGWGSMISKSPEVMVLFAVRALKLSGKRGIVLGGWAGLSMDALRRATEDEDVISYAEKNVLFVSQASHENLFPRVACTVHHGGAGTTNAALRSGVPTIITPVFVDQYDHSHLVNGLGVGIGFSTQIQKTSAEELAEAIQRVTTDEKIGVKAKDVAENLRKEDGAQAVVSSVKRFWEEDVLTGKFEAFIERDMRACESPEEEGNMNEKGNTISLDCNVRSEGIVKA